MIFKFEIVSECADMVCDLDLKSNFALKVQVYTIQLIFVKSWWNWSVSRCLNMCVCVCRLEVTKMVYNLRDMSRITAAKKKHWLHFLIRNHVWLSLTTCMLTTLQKGGQCIRNHVRVFTQCVRGTSTQPIDERWFSI